MVVLLHKSWYKLTPPNCVIWVVYKGLFLADFFHIQVCVGRNITPIDSEVLIISLHAFLYTRINLTPTGFFVQFHLQSIGIPLISDIPVHGMMGKLYCPYPEHHYELVEMLDIYLNWIINH